MTSTDLINNLKVTLLDLTYTIHRMKRKDVMKLFCSKLQEMLNVSFVTFYIYNRLDLRRQLDIYSSPDGQIKLPNLTYDYFIPYMKKKQNATLLEKYEYEISDKENDVMLFKLCNNDNFYGMMLFSYKGGLELSMKQIEEMQHLNEQFLDKVYDVKHENFINSRNDLLLQMSIKLHSVHRTIDVLERAYRSCRLLYPSFKYHFLMSQEYKTNNVPIKLLDYSENQDFSLGIKAFINNTIEIEYVEGASEETHIFAAFSGEQSVYGVLQTIIPKKVNISDSEINFVRQFTSIVGRAIERTTLFQSSNQLVTDLQTISNVSRELNKNLDRTDITETVVKHIAGTCKAEQIGVVLFPTEVNGAVYHDGDNFEVQKNSSPYFMTNEGQKFIEHLYKKIQHDTKPSFTGNFQSDEIDTNMRSLMVIPLLASESVFGVIIAAHTNPYYFSFDKFKFVQSLVQHASLAYTNSILKEQLRLSAITDYLTKLYSRNYLDERVLEEINKRKIGGFILFDIDDFKKVNDSYGHYVGDKVLVQVANLIKKIVIDKGIAARWGGEEFAIYLPNYTLDETVKMANVIRKTIYEHTDPQVTISSGVSIWANKERDSIEHLFIRTDEALYKAKTSGKNKVVAAERSVTT